MSYSKFAIDLVGQRFGKLVVLRRAGRLARRNGSAFATWCCKCDCGQEIIARGDKLRAGRKKHCGADIHFRRRSRVKGATTEHCDEYRCWYGMWERCSGKNPNHARTYRGVTVCARWMSFATFLEDMGRRPSKKHSLDRYPNVSGNYEPGNCRWATAKEQTRNKKNNIFVRYQKRKVLLVDLVEKLGRDRGTVYNRLKLGWSLKDALLTPVRPKRKNGQVVTATTDPRPAAELIKAALT